MKLFAHLLINQFGLDPRVVERGVRDTVLYGGSLVSNMLELQLAPEEILLAALSKQYGVPPSTYASSRLSRAPRLPFLPS